MMKDQHLAYKTASHMVSKTKQVVLLYEGAIRYAQQAKAAIERGDIETRFNSLVKACDIVNGLQMSLDHENGGEVAKLLYDYYAGIDMRLLSVHQSEDLEIVDLCIKHLKMMRDAWEEIDIKHTEAELAEKAEKEIDLKDPNLSRPIAEAMTICMTA